MKNSKGTSKLRALALVLAVPAALFLGYDFYLRGFTNQFSRIVSQRVAGIYGVSAAMRHYAESHEGQLPTSLEELIQASPELLGPEVIEADAGGNRILSRGIFLRDFRTVDGREQRWALLVRVPRGYPLLRDYIYSVGDVRDNSCVTVSQAKRIYGPDIVKAVYEKDALDRQKERQEAKKGSP